MKSSKKSILAFIYEFFNISLKIIRISKLPKMEMGHFYSIPILIDTNKLFILYDVYLSDCFKINCCIFPPYNQYLKGEASNIFYIPTEDNNMTKISFNH